MSDFDQLFKEYYASVYKACLVQFDNNPDYAKEITQEAFSRALVKMDDLREEKFFLSWVTAIALHYGYDKAEREQNRIRLLPPEELLEQIKNLDGHDATRIDELNHIRHWALTLKESDQELFLMKYYYLKSAVEISRETGKPRSSISLRLALIVSQLDEAMRKERASA